VCYPTFGFFAARASNTSIYISSENKRSRGGVVMDNRVRGLRLVYLLVVFCLLTLFNFASVGEVYAFWPTDDCDQFGAGNPWNGAECYNECSVYRQCVNTGGPSCDIHLRALYDCLGVQWPGTPAPFPPPLPPPPPPLPPRPPPPSGCVEYDLGLMSAVLYETRFVVDKDGATASVAADKYVVIIDKEPDPIVCTLHGVDWLIANVAGVAFEEVTAGAHMYDDLGFTQLTMLYLKSALEVGYDMSEQIPDDLIWSVEYVEDIHVAVADYITTGGF